MGVPIEVWRGRIGTFHGRSHIQSSPHSLFLHPSWIIIIFHFIIFAMLLVIGNVELNPGPGTGSYPCCHCPFQAKTTVDHITHQKLHFGTSASTFSCPFPICHATFVSFASVNAHISHHSVPRNVLTGAVDTLECP